MELKTISIERILGVGATAPLYIGIVIKGDADASELRITRKQAEVLADLLIEHLRATKRSRRSGSRKKLLTSKKA